MRNEIYAKLPGILLAAEIIQLCLDFVFSTVGRRVDEKFVHQTLQRNQGFIFTMRLEGKNC